jgi:hypothetical protein
MSTFFSVGKFAKMSISNIIGKLKEEKLRFEDFTLYVRIYDYRREDNY